MKNRNKSYVSRILSLDGGGIKGAITLGYLEAIEKLLKERYQKPWYGRAKSDSILA